jgi:hypothetical protein
MFFRKVGQMIQDQTPKPIRNAEVRLVSRMPAIIPAGPAAGTAWR